jgi:hypothetical protein
MLAMALLVLIIIFTGHGMMDLASLMAYADVTIAILEKTLPDLSGKVSECN